ncbi:DUF6177 family protein [Serinibacter salmoneus]|uniref:DUF6177 family protein n=1 Tax=Serinibacter salmoneus TaxID=556530 RepID=UPI000BF8A835|nr:DUF6177 family protein [Serinibacter salmoneus]
MPFSEYRTTSWRVTLTAPLQSFIAQSVAHGVRPILLTEVGAHVSAFVVAALRAAGGRWVAVGIAQWDALQCTLLDTVDDVLGSVFDHLEPDEAIESHPDLVDPPLFAQRMPAYLVRVHLEHRAEAGTVLGAVVEDLLRLFGAGRPLLWDVTEPVAQPWSAPALTASIREQMPIARPHLILGEGQSAAQVMGARTATGVAEYAEAWIPIRDEARVALARQGPEVLAADPHVAEVLTALTASHRVVSASVALGRLDERCGSIGRFAGYQPREAMLGSLLGPTAVSDGGLDPQAAAAQPEVTVLGRRRAPSLLRRWLRRQETGPAPEPGAASAVTTGPAHVPPGMDAPDVWGGELDLTLEELRCRTSW